VAARTKNWQILPMPRAAQVILIAFPGAQSLDISGPLEVFAHAARDPRGLCYRIIVTSLKGGAIATSSGLNIETASLERVRVGSGATVLVVGGSETAIRGAAKNDALVSAIRRSVARARRFGSVCTGAFLLAEAGLLRGHRVTTHWRAAARLEATAVGSQVDASALFVREGRLWTSAGVTAGIDMALAMVEEDSGRALADSIAAELVVYARRPGFQSQYSEVLHAQTEAGDPLRSLRQWALENLSEVNVPELARRAGLSERTLYRRIAEQMGQTPAKWLERLRLDRARALLATTNLPLKDLAERVGLRDAPQLSRSFVRAFGISPGSYRKTHGAGGTVG
jgi:transcriptional regulator GlxA family with amidase domain